MNIRKMKGENARKLRGNYSIRYMGTGYFFEFYKN
tara:strand:+ start:1690 stop:1794 length:105 start_codon:yes stop_codon:yes gene_type:complete